MPFVNLKEINKKVASLLIESGCVQVRPQDPFSYASGLKGPIYCDNRQLLSQIENRNKVGEFFSQIVSGRSDWKSYWMAGLATAGIPMASILAHLHKVPLIYVRSKPKGHGKGNQIEGGKKAGQEVIMVEDLINQASSLETAFNALVKAEFVPRVCLSIVDYEMDAAKERVKRMGIESLSLTNLSALIEAAQELGKISSVQAELVRQWKSDPATWPHQNSTKA